jgi:hypothetical protein
MWMLKYVVCLAYGHALIDMICQGVHRRYHYHYCVRCGRVTPDE